jgi:2-methylcitrate dehydratase PrpD
MTPEHLLAEFVTQLRPDAASAAARHAVRRMFMASIGAGIAGADEDGIPQLRQLLQTRGGKGEAHTFVYGDSLPAHAAAQLNGTLCRALDYCDAMAPGAHLGSSLTPTVFAAAELSGRCGGSDLLAALLVGAEVGARLNLTEPIYDGFDPTGVAVVFASTAAAARILCLSEKQTLNALGLAFNRCGGSFQSNVDATLAVRVVQGWVAQTGIECAQLALAGITGPSNFLSGVYGYCHLFGKDRLEPQAVVRRLGGEWRADTMVFKKFPSCGATQGMTELVLQLVDELALRPEDVVSVDVRLNPYCHRLVGHPFRRGDNPRVSAQFSAQYCIANAIVRRSSKLAHFKPSLTADPAVLALIGRVKCIGDPALDARGHSAVDVTVTTMQGRSHSRSLDISPGFPGNELSDDDHVARFTECMEYAARPLPAHCGRALLAAAADLSAVSDVRDLVNCLIAPERAERRSAVSPGGA